MAAKSPARNVVLWIAQGLLAAEFLTAGGMKLLMPAAKLVVPGVPLTAGFMRFIGVCEVLGAIGLVMPWLTGIRRGLTPLAAAALVVIMCGATTVTFHYMSHPMAAIPGVTGIIALLIAIGRRADLATP